MIKTLFYFALLSTLSSLIGSLSLVKNRDEQAKEEDIQFDKDLDNLRETQFNSNEDESDERDEDKEIHLLQNRQREGGKPQQGKDGKDGNKVQYSIGSGNFAGTCVYLHGAFDTIITD